MALNPNELARLAEHLRSRRNALIEELRSALADTASQHVADLLDRAPADSGDLSVADALADLSVGLVDRHVQELRDIEAASARMREGSYAICIDCGSDIAFERLLAYPTAKRCVICQQQRERTYARGGTPSL